MAPVERESSLIQFLLREEEDDKSFISVLLSWISGSFPPQYQHLGQAEAGGYLDTLRQTTPAAFTTAFLEFLRTESERVIAAQCKPESEEEEVRNATLNPTSSVSIEGTSKAKVPTRAPIEDCPYDMDFPVLGVSKANVQSIKPRRRVNPTPMESPVVDSAFVFAKLESSKQNNSSNLRARSLAPMKVDMDALMQRCEKRKSKPRIVEAANYNNKQSCKGGATEQFVPIDGVASTRGIKTMLDRSVLPNIVLSKFKRFATVHCKVVNERLVPSLVGELQYLFQLLSLGHSIKQQNQVQSVENKLFGCGNDCSLYVCIVMEHLGRVLDSVGEPLLSALIHHPMISHYAPALVMQMKQSLARHQASTLHSFKSYKISNVQTTHLQSTEVGLPVSLPFQAARDSRNHYKSRESQKLYNNRELCRDHFYGIVREAASAQNSFGYTIDDARLKTQENVKSLMNILMIENYPWFTELFLEHLIQVAVCGETDPIVTGLARQDPMKLQRLHDRLTLGNRSIPSASSVLLTLGNKASSISDSKGAVNVLKSSSQNYGTIKPEKTDEAGMELISLFPPSLRVYIWIIDAADSYRLSVQMIWSLKSKICKLAEIPQHSRDSAEIGSLLTQRVLSLKALASLLGFLCFSPGIRSQSHGFEWEICRTDPPIDVKEALDKAMARETVLLTLPWVLDYLQLVKADQYAIALPYFQKALHALRNVYSYSILDPKNDSFGVPSICILASLDRFFEFVNLPALDRNGQQTVVEPGKPHGSEKDNVCTLEGELCCGLDRIKGIVDTSYIQQCCPNLMELRQLLTNAEEQLSNRNNVSKSNPFCAKSLRKITPVHNPKSFQVSDQGSSFGLCDVSNFADNHIQVKLQQSFFEQRQDLQRLVDFVVDTIAVNAARAASSRSVPPILEEALINLETTLAHKFQCSVNKEGATWQEIEVEAEVENIITSSIQKALFLAVDNAKKLTAEKTPEALALLANPDESPFVLGIAGRIAADAAASAACKKTLANISCDIRKRITQELEGWRQRFQNAMKYNAREEKLQEEPLATSCVSRAANVASGIYNMLIENKENIEIPCNYSHKSGAAKQSVTCEVFERDGCSTIVPAQMFAVESEGYFLFERTLCCCAAVVDCCAAGVVKVDNHRHLLRVKLASICTSLEAMLASKYEKSPPGGFDSFIYADLNTNDPFLIVETGNETDASAVDSNEAAADVKFTIERGLVKRCVALALHLCLQSPLEIFGYAPDVMEKCTCFTALSSEYLNKSDILTHMKGVCCNFVTDDKSTAPARVIRKCMEPSTVTISQTLAGTTSECQSQIQVGSLMTGLLHMWESLVKCGICEAKFLISEFLSSWRWTQALQSEPWKASKFWFQAVKHGIANVLFKIVCMAQLSHRTEKSVCTCFELFFTALFQSASKQSRNAGTPDEKKMQNLRVVVVFIFSEILELNFLNKHILDANFLHLDLVTCNLVEIRPFIEACFKNVEAEE